MAVRPRLRPLLRGPLIAGVVPLITAVLLAAPPARAHGAGSGAGHSTTPSLGQAMAPSNADQLALSEHLIRVGAVFYGAWWCPACFKQKNLFGQQAGNRLPYVECDKNAAGRERCRAADIKAYPTWELNGRRVEGVQSLEELRSWSGFPRGAASGSTPVGPRSAEAADGGPIR